MIDPVSLSPEDRADIEKHKDMAAFSYVWIMSVIILALRRESKFVQYHAKQGTVLFIASIVIGIIPFIGKYLDLIVVAGMIMGFINAAQGHYRDVPIAGDLAKGKMSIADLVHLCVDGLRKIVSLLKELFTRKATSPTPPAPPVVDKAQV
jgi:uncharacterized membrane protein